MLPKITFDTVRKIALTMPGVKQSTSYGSPSLKLNGKLLAGIAINKSAEPNTLGVTVDFDQRDELLAEAPQTYYVTDHYVDYPIVLVRLSKVNEATLRDLLMMGYKFLKTNPRRKRERA